MQPEMLARASARVIRTYWHEPETPLHTFLKEPGACPTSKTDTPDLKVNDHARHKTDEHGRTLRRMGAPSSRNRREQPNPTKSTNDDTQQRGR